MSNRARDAGSRRLQSAVQALALCVAVTPFAAAAQVLPNAVGPNAVGAVNSSAFEAFDSGRALKVVPLDDTDLNLQIRDQIVQELVRAAYGTSGEGQLELSFDTAVEQGQIPSRQLSLGRVEAGSELDAQSDPGVDVEVNVWSSSQDSVLGGRKEAEGKRKTNQFRITAELRDVAARTLLWRGEVVSEMGLEQPEQLSAAMVGPLVDSLGRTVRNRPLGAE